MKKIILFLFLSFSIFATERDRRDEDLLNLDKIKIKYLDVPYATLSSAQKMDIFLPENKKGPFSTIVFIHGGAWMRGDKRFQLTNPILEALKRGYAAVTINYRLSNEAIFPAAIEDAKASIRFLRGNAKKYNLNSDKIFVFGRSAGANLAALIGTTNKTKKFDNPNLGYKDFSSEVSGVIAFYPPCNLLTMDKELDELGLLEEKDFHSNPNSPASKYMGGALIETSEKVAENNPITYISKDIPPFFVAHGTMDRTVPFTQSVLLVNALYKNSKKTTIFIPGVGFRHGDPRFFTPQFLNPMFDFIDQINKK